MKLLTLNWLVWKQADNVKRSEDAELSASVSLWQVYWTG